MRRALSILVLWPAAASPTAQELRAPAPDPIRAAFQRLYNFDFPGTHRILDEHLARHPEDPVGHSVRASAYLFYELDRLMILASEFVSDDDRISDRRRPLPPDPAIRARFFEAVERTRQLAKARLAARPDDTEALFALCTSEGLVTDYTALVEKRQIRSLSNARRTQTYAVQLLRIDPGYQDAHLTTGLSEYLIGSLPFYLRWFIRFDQVQGSKQEAVRKLEQVAEGGRYLGPFAKIMLAIIHVREKRPGDALRLLEELTTSFPENPLLRKEYLKLSAQQRPPR